MEIKDNLLIAKNVQQIECTKNMKPIEDLQYIVIHYTASTYMKGTVKYLSRSDVNASAHLIVGRDGNIFQLVPFDIQSWHAGHSYYKGLDHMNRFSIGIELMNAGKLKYISHTYYTGFGKIIPREQVISHKERSGKISYWQKYTDKQLARVKEICDTLRHEYPSIKEIVGHSDITHRKLDPGPTFPWFKVRGRRK